MENGKSPGVDGLPTEFYKVFFENKNTINNQHLTTLYLAHKEHQRYVTKPL